MKINKVGVVGSGITEWGQH